MADFQTSAALSIDIPNRELRDARRQIESELGDISISVDGSGAGASMRGGGGDGGPEMRRLADERNTLLREIVDQFQAMGGGGGGGGGRGGGGFLGTAAGSGTGTILGRLGLGGAGAGAGAAVGGGLLATLFGVGAAGGIATGGIFAGLRQLAGPRQVDRNTAQVERAERSGTGLGPAFTATSPTGLVGLAETINDRLSSFDFGGVGGSGGARPGPLDRPGAPTQRVIPPGRTGAQVRSEVRQRNAAARRIRENPGGAGRGPTGNVEVSIDVNENLEGSVVGAVNRAIESQRSRIEQRIRRDLEQDISRAAGGRIGAGGGQ